MNASHTKRLPFQAEAMFSCLILVAAFTPAARAVQFLFAPMCTLLAVYLIQRSPARYVRFVILLWFFTPFVRRVADFHAGYVEPSQILLAPILASGIAIVFQLKRFGCLFTKKFLPFSLVLLALGYGLLLGLLQLPLHAVLTDFLKWTVPILFAGYCFALRQYEGIPDLELVIESTFTWGLILMATYGVWQSFSPSPWDLYWLANVDASSFGSADREAIRVFSTMNSPGPFACTVTGGVLLLMSAKTKSARMAQVLGVVVVLLTEVRSAWIGLALGLCYIFVQSTPRLKLRMACFGAVTMAVVSLGIGLSNSTEDLTKRVETFTNLKQDESAGERLAGSRRAIANAFEHPFGGGMGYLDGTALASQDNAGSGLGNHDNGIFEFLVTLGIPGLALYAWGVLVLLMRAQSLRLRKDPAATACVAACISFLVQLPTGNSLLGVDGFIFWLSGVMVLMRVPITVFDTQRQQSCSISRLPAYLARGRQPVIGQI